jgi:hypothetical protein
MDIAPPQLSSALEPGEKLIWWDQPQGGLVLRPIDGFLIPFSILWTSFAGFGAFTALNRTTFTPEALVPSAFVVIGLYLVFGRFLYDAWRRPRTVYGLTDRRVLIVRPSKRINLSLDGASEMTLREHRNGRGSIAFGSGSGMSGWNRQGAWSGEPAVPTLEFIAEPNKVLAAIREAQKKRKSE